MSLGMRNLHLLVEGPADGHATSTETAEEFLENLLADIDGAPRACWALVSDDACGTFAVCGDGDLLVAKGVAIGHRTHQVFRQSNDIVSVILAGVILATRAQANLIIGDFTGELLRVGAGAGAGATVTSGRRRGRSRRRRGRSRNDSDRAGSGGGSRRRRRRRRSDIDRRSRRSWREGRRRASLELGLLWRGLGLLSLGFGLLRNGRGRLVEIAIGLAGDCRSRSRRLVGRDPDSSGPVDHLSDIGGLGNPLDDGDHIARDIDVVAQHMVMLVVSVMRLRGGGSDKGGTSDS
jgi:hypothetical protein